MKNFINFLKTDVKLINSYFLLAVISIILISIGYSSYALFSYGKTSNNVIEGTVGKINYTTNFSYTGSCTTYTAKSAGYYNLEVWGAQGGNYNTTYVGGLGGYSKGIVHLEKGTTLYVCVGGQPQTVTTTKTAVPGGFNGGGNGFNRDYSSTYTYGQAGGGATDIRIGHGKATITYIGKEITIYDTSGANAPVLASNMIPVYYDETQETWKKANTNNIDKNNPWYSYNPTGNYKGMWANAVTVTETNRTMYLNAEPGTTIPMDDINTMWVWIPRFNAVTPSNYNGGTQASPGAIDVTFVKENETAIDAFTFGNKQLSGFWYAKFETSHSTLSSSTTVNNLECTTETCSNANGIIIKPNVVSLRYNDISNSFFASRSMEQSGNSFGFVNSEVDTHMSKNNEWGAVAYLTQSIYGRCTNSTACTEVGINNNSSYITGYGAPAGSSSSITNGAYNTILGKDASITGTIYGIYDMSGGAWEDVMAMHGSTSDSSGFAILPEKKYYNTSYSGQAVTETKNWYNDNSSGIRQSIPWFNRGGYYSSSTTAGVFAFSLTTGSSDGNFSSRFVITNE